MNSEGKIKVLMLVHELEQTLGRLYATYAGQFPEHRAFWLKLAQEEEGHADAVRRLYQLSYEGRSLFQEGALRADAIQSVLTYVKEQVAAAALGQPSAQRALSVTYDLERSLLERDIFAHFEVSPELSGVLTRLNKETSGHMASAKRELDLLKERTRS